jgi:hypothetical protein
MKQKSSTKVVEVVLLYYHKFSTAILPGFARLEIVNPLDDNIFLVS